MKEPIYKYQGKLYSNLYWTENIASCVGDISDLIDLLVGKGKIGIDTITYYYLRDSDVYTEDPYKLLQDSLDELGVEVEE